MRRKIGISVQDQGGNAVLGYRQHFDFEGESGKGIVARGYGTACVLTVDQTDQVEPNSPSSIPSSSSFVGSSYFLWGNLMVPNIFVIA